MKLPPHLWLRILSSFIFFGGGILFVIWSSGYRLHCYKSKNMFSCEFIKTGVVSTNSLQNNASVFINDEFKGFSPNFFLSIPVGRNKICFYKNNYYDFCSIAEIENEVVYFYENVYLIPKEIKTKNHGSAELFVWDTKKRGLVKKMYNSSSFLVFSNKGNNLIEDIEINNEDDISLDSFGRLIINDHVEKTIFVNQSINDSLYNDLLIQSNVLYKVKEKNQIIKDSNKLKIYEFSEEIENAFYISNSESIIVILKEEIFIIQKQGSWPHKILNKDEDLPAIYFPQRNSIFFKYQNEVHEFEFK